MTQAVHRARHQFKKTDRIIEVVGATTIRDSLCDIDVAEWDFSRSSYCARRGAIDFSFVFMY